MTVRWKRCWNQVPRKQVGRWEIWGVRCYGVAVGCHKLVLQTAGGQAMVWSGTAECGQVLWSAGGQALQSTTSPCCPGLLKWREWEESAGFPIDFSCTKLAGKVAIGHHMIVGCCNCYNCKPIDKELNCAGDIMTIAILRTGHRSLSFSAIVVLNGCWTMV